MGLNCKPGDMARIISHPATEALGIVDKIIEVKRINTMATLAIGEPAWEYGPEKFYCCENKCSAVEFMPDDLLRPIRDPGDDAVDEMLKLAPPVPATNQPVEA